MELVWEHEVVSNPKHQPTEWMLQVEACVQKVWMVWNAVSIWCAINATFNSRTTLLSNTTSRQANGVDIAKFVS